MKLEFKIAWRYFRGKKNIQAINIISWISISAIAISAAAMVILFSVFNGLEATIKNMYTSFYPEYKITGEKGKFFQITESQKQDLSKIPEVSSLTYCIEDMVLVSHNEEQKVAILKGVDNKWFDISELERYMLEGDAKWQSENSSPYIPVLMGVSMMASLNVDMNSVFSDLAIFYPDLSVNIAQNPESALNNYPLKTNGIFHIQEEFDGHYILAPLAATQEVFKQQNSYSSIEMKAYNPHSETAIKKEIQSILGKEFIIETRFEQNKTLYMVMQSEKWAIYAILLLVLIIASFNMIGSLSMLVLEKKKDIIILKSMGANKRVINRIFLIEGMILALVGGGTGIILGYLISLGQKYFGWIELPSGFIVQAYPVGFKLEDFILVFITCLFIGLFAAWFPARKAGKQAINFQEG